MIPGDVKATTYSKFSYVKSQNFTNFNTFNYYTIVTLYSMHYYYLHLTNKKTEAQIIKRLARVKELLGVRARIGT